MLFHSRTRYYFTNIAILIFILLVLPFKTIKFVLYTLIFILSISNIFVTPLVYNYKKTNLFISEYIIKIFIFLKLYSKNNIWWKYNYYHMYAIIICISIISSLDYNMYVSIVSGLFTGAIIAAIFEYLNFSYQKFIFNNELDRIYKELIIILEQLHIILTKLCLGFCPNNIYNINVDISDFEKLWNDFLSSLKEIRGKIKDYDDSSIVSINAYHNINNKKFTKKIKEVLINIVTSSININLINSLNNTARFCDIMIKINPNILDILKSSKFILYQFENKKPYPNSKCLLKNDPQLSGEVVLLVDSINKILPILENAKNSVYECYDAFKKSI